MIKNHKWKAVISSIVILLPVIFGIVMWKQLPATMVSHWGADGVADGTASKWFMVLVTPLIFLAIHWFMLWVMTAVDKNNTQNNKITGICYGILPVLSLVVHVFIYSIALGKEWKLIALIPVVIGAAFMLIGNYLPKTTRNRTMGIKLHWTMGNDENWNKTHRLGGMLWFWGGLVILASAILPVKIMVGVMVVFIAISIIVPTVYSYSIYKKHKAEGVEYEPVFNKKSDKVAIWITAIFVPLILIGTTVLLFTGNIEVAFTDTDFKIVASYAEDITVSYGEVDSVEYRESFDIGIREFGFGSPRLSTGTFKNAEFGRYSLYAYTQGQGAVVLKNGDSVLVIVAKTAEETKAIYDTIASKVQ